MKQVFAWQEFPASKKELAGFFKIQVEHDPKLAAVFRKRTVVEEAVGMNYPLWIFVLKFYNKKKAIKSINKTIRAHGYPPLVFNASEEVFESQKGPIRQSKSTLTPKKEVSE